MSQCSKNLDVSGGGYGAGVGCPILEDIGRQEEGAGMVKEVSYVTISDRA